MKVLSLTFLLVLLFAAESDARTLLVYAGTPRGGSGDIAANLLMARHLKTLNPDDQIILAVDENAGIPGITEAGYGVPEILRRLIPNYRPRSSRVTLTEEGVEIRSVHGVEIPRADYGFAFSHRISDGYPSWLVERSRFTFFFGDHSSEPMPTIESTESVATSPIHIRDNTVTPTPNGLVLTLPSGALSTGLYVLPNRPDPPLTRTDLNQSLLPYVTNSHLYRLFLRARPSANPLHGNMLGVAYTYHAGPTQRYIDLLKQLATFPPYNDRDLVIFVRSFEGLEIRDLPENLQVYEYEAMPAPVLESLMAHASLPIQITGNVSMSLAAQYGKLYFPDHSSPGTVVGGPIGILRRLEDHDEYFRQPDLVPLFSNDGVHESASLSPRAQLRFGAPTDSLLSLSQDTGFGAHFVQAHIDLTPRWSLPLRVSRYMEALDGAREALAHPDPAAIAAALTNEGCHGALRMLR